MGREGEQQEDTPRVCRRYSRVRRVPRAWRRVDDQVDEKIMNVRVYEEKQRVTWKIANQPDLNFRFSIPFLCHVRRSFLERWEEHVDRLECVINRFITRKRAHSLFSLDQMGFYSLFPVVPIIQGWFEHKTISTICLLKYLETH